MLRPRAVVVITDPFARSALEAALSDAGFAVETAVDAEAAARTLDAHGARTTILASAEAGGRGLLDLEALRRSPVVPFAIVGCSGAVQRARDEALRLAGTDLSLWLIGPAGSGKEHVARAVHTRSARSDRPFVVVDCRGLGGGEADALWSAGPADRGVSFFEQARGGTLYLDEITALTLDAQHALERRLAEAGAASTDLRVVASCEGDPETAIAQRRLLRPLHRRVAHATIVLPPLADRSEDVPLLARHFANEIVAVNDLGPLRFDAAAVARLAGYGWPGNVQELRAAVEHAAIVAGDGAIGDEQLPERIRAGVSPAVDGGSAARNAEVSFRAAKREVVEAFERAYLSQLLDRHRGNVTAAAGQSGMLRSALQRLLRKYAIKSVQFRETRRSRARGGRAPERDARPLDAD